MFEVRELQIVFPFLIYFSEKHWRYICKGKKVSKEVLFYFGVHSVKMWWPVSEYLASWDHAAKIQWQNSQISEWFFMSSVFSNLKGKSAQQAPGVTPALFPDLISQKLKSFLIGPLSAFLKFWEVLVMGMGNILTSNPLKWFKIGLLLLSIPVLASSQKLVMASYQRKIRRLHYNLHPLSLGKAIWPTDHPFRTAKHFT